MTWNHGNDILLIGHINKISCFEMNTDIDSNQVWICFKKCNVILNNVKQILVKTQISIKWTMGHQMNVGCFEMGLSISHPCKYSWSTRCWNVLFNLVDDVLEFYLTLALEQIGDFCKFSSDIENFEDLEWTIVEQLIAICLFDRLENTIQCISLILIGDRTKMRMATTEMTSLWHLLTSKTNSVIVEERVEVFTDRPSELMDYFRITSTACN